MDFEKALHSPDDIFANPEEVVKSKDFTLEQKIKILEHWEYDAKQHIVADEENMRGTEDKVSLAEIEQALLKLKNSS